MKLLTIFITSFLIATASYAEGIFERIDSVIEEEIAGSVKVRLIDVVPGLDQGTYLSLDIFGEDVQLNSLVQYYKKSGYKYQRYSFYRHNQLIIKLPEDELEGVLEYTIGSLQESQLNSLTLTVMGQINQQRVLGNINRIILNSKLVIEPKVGEVASKDSEVITFPLPLINTTERKSKAINKESSTEFLTVLLLCGQPANKIPVFLLTDSKYFCSPASVSHKVSIDDKFVANYKGDLRERFQFINTNNFEWLQVYGSYDVEDSYDLFSSFYSEIKKVSIEKVIELYGKYHIEKPLEDAIPPLADSNRKINKKLNQDFIDRIEIETYEITHSKNSLNITIAINLSESICESIDCESTPYFLELASSATQTFSFNFSPGISEQVIQYIKNNLLPVILRDDSVKQSDVMVALGGEFGVEQLEAIFFSLAKVPPSSKLSLSNDTEPFEIIANLQSNQIILPVLPGDQNWANSELLYYVLQRELPDNTAVTKDNSLIGFKPNPFYNLNRRSSVISIGSKEEGVLQLKAVQAADNSQFIEWKQGLLKNIKLQSKGYRESLIEQLFMLKNYRNQLSQRLRDLSFEDFKMFTAEILANYSD